MTQNSIIDSIISIEWEMFSSVNGDIKAGCQENYDMFYKMRSAQYHAWSEELCGSWLNDVVSAKNDGRNLSREKYIRMMITTDPEGYLNHVSELPPITGECEALARQINDELIAQTISIREKYPLVSTGGRPLRSSSDTLYDTSVETYQRCELETYSLQTLTLLYRHLMALKAEGRDLALIIQENTVKTLGFESLQAAELVMAKQQNR